MDRATRIRAMFDTSGLGLEIGPSYNPVVPKAMGFNVEILDYTDQSDLVRKYTELNVDTNFIETVDYVSDGRSMVDVIGKRGCYDYIVASHVIEHAPDLAGFVSDCAELLKPNGVLILAVPDKRYCFDILRPLSSLGQVMQAHAERRTRHAPSAIFDHGSLFCRRNNVVGWGTGNIGELSLDSDVHKAMRMFEDSYETDSYIDVHGWIFTPSSFRYIMKGLSELGVIPLQEQEFQGTDYFEFLMTFSRNAKGCDIGYLELAKRTTIELRDIYVPGYEDPEIERHSSEIDSLRTELARLHQKVAHLKKYRDRRLAARLSKLYSRIRA